jgi:translation initiation factor IF-1
MPRNLKGGNKAKKKSNKDTHNMQSKDIPYPNTEENSHIAKVIKVYGGCRFNVQFISDTGLKNEEMLAHLSRTASRRQGRIILDSVIKVSKRDFEDKCDILYQYNPSEIQKLVKENHINVQVSNDDDDNNIEFTNEIANNENDIDISAI